jgi:hypothetical protein
MADYSSDDGAANNGFGRHSLHQWEGRLLYMAADLVPADNSMPMDAALAWSRQDWEREQAEQQRWLLDLARARCRAEAAAQPARGGAPVVKLEDSNDDDLYRPTPPRFGDAGQGLSRWTPGQSSQQVPPPQDDGGDSSDDDGGDYTRFYRHFDM